MKGKISFSGPSFKVCVVAFCFILSQWINPSVGRSAKPGAQKVPASLLEWPEKGSPYAILVDKSLQKIFVYHKGNLFKPYKTYNCSTGENDGPKARQNDHRTPEGIYFFTHTLEEKDLAPIYGSRALVLDYPNPVDRMEGKRGYGIWFHGLNKPLKPTDTKGCIAVENGDIDDLASLITLQDTPVIISAKIEMVDPSELEKEKEELAGVIETWRSAWQHEDIDRYMSVYNKRFTSSRKNWHQWKEYKARLAKQYQHIKVEVMNLRILRNGGLVMATFIQKYGNEHFDSMGKKALFLQQNSREWKIIGEHFESSGIQPVTAVTKPSAPPPEPVVEKKVPPTPVAAPAPEVKAAGLAAMSDMAEIRDFLDRWKKAWEKKTLGVYMACYDSGFQSGNVDFKAWRARKEKLNRKYRSISVDIQDLKVEQPSPLIAKVSFRQKYKADDYQDAGLKNLLLIKKGKLWKIKEEEWQPLDPGSRP